MSDSDLDFSHTGYENSVSRIIERSLIDLYGINGYKSIIKTLKKECKKSEKEIIGNYELFEDAIQKIFGRIGDVKILDPIKIEMNRIGMDEQNHTITRKQVPMADTIPTRLLIADDEPHLLELYQDWLKFDNRQVITAENGQKCLEIYRKEYYHSKLNHYDNYFDVVILDHIMPELNGVQTAIEILKINPNQRIIFASGYIEKILSESLTKTNKLIEVIKKPFSIEALDDMINNKTIFNKFEEINSNHKDVAARYSNAITILNNHN